MHLQEDRIAPALRTQAKCNVLTRNSISSLHFTSSCLISFALKLAVCCSLLSVKVMDIWTVIRMAPLGKNTHKGSAHLVSC